MRTYEGGPRSDPDSQALPAAVSRRVAQVHDERVEIIGQTFGRGGEAVLVEMIYQGLQSLLAVALEARASFGGMRRVG